MSEIRSLVDPGDEYSVRFQCTAMEINRSSLYYVHKGESQENLEIMREMDKHFMDRPTAGVLRMQDFLLTLGLVVNHKRIRRLLRLMGLMAIYPKRNLSKLGERKYIHPYLLKGLVIDRPNQVWAIDITYVPMKKGFMYLTAIIDVYSRFIVGWGISNSLEAEASLNVLKQAISDYGTPEIINSDQGSQFTCEAWVEYLQSQEIKISMEGKGRAIDNIFIERFFRSLKYDHIYLRPASDGLELYEGVKGYMHLYNHKYAHQGIGREIPATLYFQAAA